jgi:lysyl endopeptidase
MTDRIARFTPFIQKPTLSTFDATCPAWTEAFVCFRRLCHIHSEHALPPFAARLVTICRALDACLPDCSMKVRNLLSQSSAKTRVYSCGFPAPLIAKSTQGAMTMRGTSTQQDFVMNKQLLGAAAMLLGVICSSAMARQGDAPYSIGSIAKHGLPVAEVTLPAIDGEALRHADDAKLQDAGQMHDKRLAIARSIDVAFNPATSGQWQILADGSLLWRLRVHVPGATDLHLGFESGKLTPGASLWVIGANDYYEGPYTADDAMPLWIPMVPGDSAIVEIHLPAGSVADSQLPQLSDVGGGFRDLFNPAPRIGQPGASGACNINVVCPLGQAYSAEERALAYYEFRADDDGLTYICTATLLNDVPADRKNYVLTAAHCMSSQSEAATMRLYWNYKSADCVITTGWSFAQNQTGASLRATRADADFTLVELNQEPNPTWNLFHAGWDADGIAPSSSIGLHHPRGDVAKVDNSPTAPRSTYNCIGTGNVNVNTHWYTGPYDQGTTEGGSSGSGLWIPSSDASGRGRRLIGTLSGGTAACFGTVPDNGIDCYGKFSSAWDGPSPSSRLRDWLDPASTGTKTIAGVDHAITEPPPVNTGIAVRAAADRQALPARSQQRGLGGHPSPFNPLQRKN